MELNDYCRQIEAYLCRKNDGHLVRIVGPAFEQVCAWGERGVPLRVAFGGIDRYFDRYYAKGPRRRPVRVEFCEADILDVFDEWRRAVGVVAGGEGTEGEGARGKGAALPAHIERAIARLASARAVAAPSLKDTLDSILRELDVMVEQAKGARGHARATLLASLRALDALLLDAARTDCPTETMTELDVEAEAELAPFRGRLAADAYDVARRACGDRLVRERLRLPTITYSP